MMKRLPMNLVGFDRLFDEIASNASLTRDSGGYPPYDVVKVSDTEYAINVAVAGFEESELDVVLEDDTLKVKGEKSESNTSDDPSHEQFIYKGISRRKFTRVFKLHEYVQVKNASLKNGILSVDLEYVVPESRKPRKIEIHNVHSNNSPHIEHSAATEPQLLNENVA